MIRRNIFLILFLSIALFSNNLYSNDKNLIEDLPQGREIIDKAWESFYKNDIKSARAFFTEASSLPQDKAEAHLALAFLATVDKKPEDAFKEFMNFYRSTSEPQPYLFALWTHQCLFEGYGKKDKEQLTLLNELVKNPNLNSTLIAMSNALLGYHYNVANNAKASEEEFKKIGAIEDWQVVGEFENISASGFDKNYDPVNYPQKDHAFINKYGAQVYWFDIPALKNDKWLDLTYHMHPQKSIVYAQTFVNSPVDQEIQLRMGNSGSLKVWLNDQQVFSESEERNNDMDTYVVQAKLHKGYNRLLIQLGESEVGRSNCLVRITDLKGNVVSGLRYSKSYQAYTKEANYQPKIINIDAEDYFADLIEKYPNKIINYLLMAETYLRNDKNYEARKILMKAQKIAPQCSYIYMQLIELYTRDDNKTELAVALEWVKEHDPTNPYSLVLQIEEELNKENYNVAEEKIKQLKSLYGEDEKTLSYDIGLAGYYQKQKEIIDLVEMGYKKYPEFYAFVSLKHMIELQVNKDYNAAINVLKKYLKANYHEEVVMSIANDYFSKGDKQMGIETYKTLVKNNPAAPGYRDKLAGIYFQLQDYTNAEFYYKEALIIAPQIDAYWFDLGKIYEAQGNINSAADAYKKAITYAPNYYEARRQLRKLLEKKEVFEYFEQPDVYATFKNAPDKTSYPEDNSLILLNEVQKVVYSGGASEEKHVFVVKVFNAQGLDRWKQYSVSYSMMQDLLIEKAEVIKANGSKVAASTNGGSVVFNSLEEGDAIHVTYRIENYQVGKLSPHFWDQNYFSHYFPFQKTKYSLLISPDVKFTYKFTGEEIKPLVSKHDDFDMYIWEKANQEGIKTEDRMPALADVANVMHLSSFPDWTFISNWYYDLASTKAKSDFEVQETVATLFAGRENMSKIEKVKEIYNYIVKNIRYSSVSFLQSGLIPQKSSKVLNTKIGDCKDVSTLFVAMCKEIGVNASWVLVNTRDKGKKDLYLPSIDFNHCIAKFTLDGKEYYIELTSDYLPFNSMYGDLIEAYTLDIVNEAEKIKVEPVYLNPVNRKLNSVYRKTEISVDNTDLLIKQASYKSGIYAAGMRSSYRDLGKQEQEKKMESVIGDDFSQVKLLSLNFTGLNERTDTVLTEYTYMAYNAVTSVGGLSLFSIPWVSKTTSKDFIFNANRKLPMEFENSLDSDMETMSIKIPAGKILAEIPKDINYTCSVADYTLKYKVDKGTIMVSRELKYKKDNVPLADINEFSEFYKKVISADSKQLAFK
jgi:tetratricopeptide (TPR) repeat protein